VNVYEEYKSYGMQVVAFPCSQFLDQEVKTDEEVIDFARNKMGAEFPLMQRCNVNGEEAHPVFKMLRKQTECFHNKQTGKIRNIPWNFTKFIVDSTGKVVMYQNPRESLYRRIDEIEVLLGLRGGPDDFEIALE
jgi:glutathione peroxidase